MTPVDFLADCWNVLLFAVCALSVLLVFIAVRLDMIYRQCQCQLPTKPAAAGLLRDRQRLDAIVRYRRQS